MPRRPIVLHKKISYDPRFNDAVVGRFLNILMRDGKKSTAERVFYGAFDVIQEKTGNEPLKVFQTALSNVKPVVEVKSRRVGGASYQVPVEIRPVRQIALALRWIKAQCDVKVGSEYEGKACCRADGCRQ